MYTSEMGTSRRLSPSGVIQADSNLADHVRNVECRLVGVTLGAYIAYMLGI